MKFPFSLADHKWNKVNNDHPRFIDDPRNILYREFVRLVRGLEPKFFVMENVSGMVSHNGGGTVKHIVKDFSRIGYRTDWRILDGIKQKLSDPAPPAVEKKSYCRKCNYYELCWC